MDETSTMISLRRFPLSLCVLAAATACDRATSPDSIQPSFDKVTAGAAVDARIQVTNQGVCTIELRSGTYSATSGAQAANGSITHADYQVYDLRFKNPKLVLNRTVSIDAKDTVLTFFSEQIPADNGDTHVDPQGKPSHDIDGPFLFNPQPTGCHSDVWQIVSNVHLKGVASNPKADVVVSDTAVFICPGPDITTQPSAQGVQVGTGLTIGSLSFAPPGAQTEIQAGAPAYYEVGIRHTGPGGTSSVGANVACQVQVFKQSGTAWVPDPAAASLRFRWVGADGSGSSNAFSAGPAQIFLPPNGTSYCQFTLTLTGAGTQDSIAVTATSDEPDYDPTNNMVGTVFSLVDHAVIPPPPEGTSVGRAMEDAYYLGPTPSNPGPFLGLALQKTDLDNLTSLILGRRLDPASTAQFGLRIQMWTAKKKANGDVDPSTAVPMGDVTWMGNVSDLASLPDGGCLASPVGLPATAGGVGIANGATTTAGLCITLLDAGATGLGQPGVKLAVIYHWNTTPPNYAGTGLVRYLDYLRFHADITFTDPNISGPLGGTANLRLTDGSFDYNNDPRQLDPSLFSPPIAFPTPTVSVAPATVQTNPTATTYTVVARAIGAGGFPPIPFSVPSSSTLSTDVSSLSASNCNSVTWAAVAGAYDYAVYRIQSGQYNEVFAGSALSYCDGNASSLGTGPASAISQFVTPFVKVHKNQR